jgi:hypothetical protein
MATISEMESMLDEFGAPNEEALRTIKRSVFALKCRDGYFNGKLDEFESWAKIGLSTRKFQRWGVDSQTFRSKRPEHGTATHSGVAYFSAAIAITTVCSGLAPPRQLNVMPLI